MKLGEGWRNVKPGDLLASDPEVGPIARGFVEPQTYLGRFHPPTTYPAEVRVRSRPGGQGHTLVEAFLLSAGVIFRAELGDNSQLMAIGRYAGPDGVTAVSSCDVYEFTDGILHTITSYAAEVDPDDPYATAGTGS